MAQSSAEMLKLRILETMTESQARWYVAGEAMELGRGGIAAMRRLTGTSRPTVLRGVREPESGEALSDERVRQPGGGRKRIEHGDPGLTAALERIMGENTAGDPMSPLRRTHKPTERIARELTRRGHPVGARTVQRRLGELGYSPQVNSKSPAGASPPERDAQFRHINRQVAGQVARGEPVLSVDAKKKEKVGRFRNNGKAYRPTGGPHRVNTYDFPNLSQGPAIPYGAYDQSRNEGFVNVGMTRDTAEFAVESLRRWWKRLGRVRHPDAESLLLCADGGGGNGSRVRAWKWFLQQLADDLKMKITVCRYPPGASKWNKIEHRMFSFISLNRAGEPLESHQLIIDTIGATTTRTGLRIKAALDSGVHPTKIKISKEQMSRISLQPHDTHPKWNYTITPTQPVC